MSRGTFAGAARQRAGSSLCVLAVKRAVSPDVDFFSGALYNAPVPIRSAEICVTRADFERHGVTRLRYLPTPIIYSESNMNRLQLIGQASETTSQTDNQLDDLGLVPAPDTAHCLFAPLHYEPKYAYPLLVWLHGPHGDENELFRVIPEISMRNYVGVGPRGNQRMEDGRGCRWGDADEQLGQAEQIVFDAIDAACQRYHVAPSRIFLAGFEAGGTMAFRIGLRHPDRFAGALSIGGPFPLGGTPLGQLEYARTLPLFIAQGRESETYPVEMACQELRLFHTAGLGVTVRQYPCGDEVDTQMLKDMDTWIMEQVTGTPSVEHPTYFLGDAP